MSDDHDTLRVCLATRPGAGSLQLLAGMQRVLPICLGAGSYPAPAFGLLYSAGGPTERDHLREVARGSVRFLERTRNRFFVLCHGQTLIWPC